MKTVYNYHPETKQYIGMSYADESPLEPNVWLIPAHSTEIEPPEELEGKQVIYDEFEWKYVDICFEDNDEQPIVELTYYQKRILEYPSIGDQLDALFKAGAFPEEMASQIQAVKDKYPKQG